ncbi:MAG: efflux RND transporter periplasmic adaptor subunit [Polyangiaceae bacterium]|nr:efflux RND transporter periplasmic adaptor subunit [Myxococcales bacterium]MCB9586093.1 efflux RND transporter periplasmic adaptor subunit [Polyangiaceae bacterium]MCB9608890.1 efflux RND transporter periplasmic adaptor subunit [Polyangiaceae bacterium]
MFKKVALTIVALLVVVGVIGGAKGAQIAALIQSGKTFVPPPETVTAIEAKEETWEDNLTAVGTVVALQGITVTTESPGVVRDIRFESGEMAKKGALLVRLDTSVEAAQVAQAAAQRNLAKVNLERAEKLQKAGVAAQAELDSAKAQAKQTSAQVGNYGAVLARKIIKAPFTGRLGIRQVDLGEYVTPGAPIVTLQDLTSVYVDFRLPQSQVAVLSQAGLKVRVSSDAFPKEKWEGTIHAVDAAIDSATRNVRVRAIFKNPDERLKAGMFVNVSVVLPTKQKNVVVPATSIQYAPYGDSVFLVVDAKNEDGSPKEGKEAKQAFIRLGERRGDFVAVASGLEANQMVVTSGGFKLKNGMSIVVDNTLQPDAKKNPSPEDK